MSSTTWRYRRALRNPSPRKRAPDLRARSARSGCALRKSLCQELGTDLLQAQRQWPELRLGFLASSSMRASRSMVSSDPQFGHCQRNDGLILLDELGAESVRVALGARRNLYRNFVDSGIAKQRAVAGERQFLACRSGQQLAQCADLGSEEAIVLGNRLIAIVLVRRRVDGGVRSDGERGRRGPLRRCGSAQDCGRARLGSPISRPVA